MLREFGKGIHAAWVLIDAMLVASVCVLLVSRPEMQRVGPVASADHLSVALLAAAAVLGWPLMLSRMGVYASLRRQTFGAHLGGLALANSIGSVALAAIAFALEVPVAPATPFVLAGLIFTLQAATRLPLFYVLRALRRAGRNTRNVLIIGAGPRARQTRDTIVAHPEWGLNIVGYVDDLGEGFEAKVPLEQVHEVEALPALLRDHPIDEALVACPRAMLDSLMPIVSECSMIGIPVTILSDLFGGELPPPIVGTFGELATLSFAPVHHDQVELGFKRLLDVIGACVGLLVSAPFIAIAAIGIKLSSSGPVFFLQERCGTNGRRFRMPKLRTMYVDAEERKQALMHLNEMDGPVFKIKDDPRITPIGGLLRKWSIDELPQFWSVLLGDMSLVGPRPPTPDEVEAYEKGHRRRLSMRPGITCLWQVSGRNEISFQEWMELDVEYIDSWSLANDLRILARTVPQVLMARGAR